MKGSDEHTEKAVDRSEPPSLPMYPIRDSADVCAHFQHVLDRFPRVVKNGEKQIQFAEFSAFLLRPKENDLNQLSHILFPESIIVIPDSDVSLEYHSCTTFPQVTLLADAETDELFVKVSSFRTNADNHMTMVSLILSMDEVVFINDVWDMISVDDRANLSPRGYRRGMSHRDWGSAINVDMTNEPTRTYPTRDLRMRVFRELPVLINSKGTIGSNGTSSLFPEFIVYALQNNGFFYDEDDEAKSELDRFFELGDVHVHSLVNDMDPLQQAVADIVGADVVRRNPSIPDIYSRRSSQGVFGTLSKFYTGREIRAMTGFAGIVAVDGQGLVQGARYFDFRNADARLLSDLNDRAYDSMYNSSEPDVQLIAEHYRYINSVTTEDFGTEDTSGHVGDPDYDRRQDPDCDWMRR